MRLFPVSYTHLDVYKRQLSTVRTPVREGMTRVMRDKRFVTYVLTLAGYYMLAVQVMLMLPIMVNDVAGAPSAVKWMYRCV